MRLYHYYENERGPFDNLSDLSLKEAENVLLKLKEEEVFASKRDITYMKRRFDYEDMVRDLFIRKNGKVYRHRPHYMTLEKCSWIKKWYKYGRQISIDLNDINTESISFTYGDMFPVFGPKGNDSAWYRKQVYTYEEILKIIDKYGLPQEVNPNGEKGPIRYIEAQIWSDELINIIRKINNI